MVHFKKRILFAIGMLIMFSIGSKAGEPAGSDFARLRESMVTAQIEGRGVKNVKVRAAMRKVERHRFVPKSYRREAYEDHPIPIGEGQTISQPYVVALMSEMLEPDSSMRILEIGTGSGYQAAVLAEIVDSVYTIDIISELAQRARRLLKELGYNNIAVRVGDGYKGWKEAAPFNGIIVTCAPSHVPVPLKDQLAEGGRMVIPVGKGLWGQELVLLTKRAGELSEETVIPVRFVPMLKEDGGRY
jgi:protein-L-isoaspartate(D-aspartate) O-methyltransferase